jgi:putative ABC transport system permease protein
MNMSFPDFWYEIYESAKRRPLRIILTGIGITWGVFILILLVGVGSGFEKGVLNLFKGFAKSTTYVYASETSISYKSTPVGKKILFTEKDLEILKRTIPEIDRVSPETGRSRLVLADTESGWFETRGVYPEYFTIKILDTKKGRLLNTLDMLENRKVALVGQNVVDALFHKQNPIGKHIQINQELYRIIGIIKNSMLRTTEARVVYLPYSTYLNANNEAKEFSTILFSLKEKSNTQKVVSRIKSIMSRQYQFDPSDENIFYIESMEVQIKAFTDLFTTLRGFLWFMGISTLISGIIGVANIMYASVRERTREIGIRKSVGAKTADIKTMILWESIAVTSIAGYLGLMLGWGVLKIIAAFISEDTVIMEKPGLDVVTAFAAVFILVFAGTLVGLKPAVYAAELNPIDALKEEN